MSLRLVVLSPVLRLTLDRFVVHIGINTLFIVL